MVCQQDSVEGQKLETQYLHQKKKPTGHCYPSRSQIKEGAFCHTACGDIWKQA